MEENEKIAKLIEAQAIEIPELVALDAYEVIGAKNVNDSTLAQSRADLMYQQRSAEISASFLLAMTRESILRELRGGGGSGVMLGAYTVSSEGQQLDQMQTREHFAATARSSAAGSRTVEHPVIGTIDLSCEASFDSGVIAGFFDPPAIADVPFTPSEMQTNIYDCVDLDKDDVDTQAVFWGGLLEGMRLRQETGYGPIS
jgi:hypothetical protein